MQELEELKPRIYKQKSYYGKAWIEKHQDESSCRETLYSYGVPVIELYDGEVCGVYKEAFYSNTTLRHVADYLCTYACYPKYNKKEVIELYEKHKAN